MEILILQFIDNYRNCEFYNSDSESDKQMIIDDYFYIIQLYYYRL